MVGTIGPLVQGGLPRVRWRVQMSALFAAAFLAGATTIFCLSFVLGMAGHVLDLSVSMRRSIAAAGLVILALMDMWARNRKGYCPIGWSRQTPRDLRRRHSMLVVASIWGFYTGLAITTFRVAAATWGAILLTLLGLSGWQTGIAYGVAFAFPMTILLWTHRMKSGTGMKELLDMGRVWQARSAVLLVAGSVLLVSQNFRGAG